MKMQCSCISKKENAKLFDENILIFSIGGVFFMVFVIFTSPGSEKGENQEKGENRDF